MFLATNAFGWGNATHTYFSKQLGVTRGHLNYDEMYGSVLPDAFNLMLNEKGGFMADQCHHNFMPFVQRARTCGQRAAAFGFASHNDNWGADYTAHHNSFTFPNHGYAIEKGQLLAPAIIVVLVPILMNAGLDSLTATGVAAGLAPEFGHDLSETAVDLWVKRTVDPSIGTAMVQTATRRSSDVGQLLADTYAASLASVLNIPPVEAKKFIMNAERQYRDQMIQYGRVLLLPEEQSIGALAVFNAMIAEGFIKALVGVDVIVTPELVADFIVQAIALVAGDYQNELAQTLAYLDNQMQAHSIATCNPPHRAGKEGDVTANAVASEFSLHGNYPNPFNPSTTISFAVPEAATVTLEIYNVLGQRVRTLVKSETYQPGTWSAQWDGSNDAGIMLPSGAYFSRLVTPRSVFTKKMVMIK